MNEIALIGAGGIGSELAEQLYKLICKKQINLSNTKITVIDDDVVEIKNKLYQNFRKEDITKHKARVIGVRYNFDYKIERINEDKDLDPYNIFLVCVDNSQTRLLVYTHCLEKNKFFIDGRAEGKSYAVFVKKNQTLEDLKKTLGKGGPTSCQLKQRLDDGMIDLGNVMIAPKMAQCLLNHLRGESNISMYSATM